jgi:serine/threonine protein phosphatase PrpC
MSRPSRFLKTLSEIESAPKTIRIPEAAKVFVLEDSPERIKWFRHRIPQAIIASNAEQALALLDEQTFDVCFLDHDLSFSDVAFPDMRPGSGQRVAHHLAQTRFSGIVIIHSVHEAGARAMKNLLGRAHALPFGTFEIKDAVSSNPLLNASAETEKGAKGCTATIYAASVPQPGHANEDALFVGRLSGAPLAAVFDGQGNAEGAAKKAARQLERLYTESASRLDWARTAKLLDSHLLGSNKSTMVAASLAEDVISICAVGDSRAYLVRGGQANILTEGASKRQMGSGAIQPLVKQFRAQDRDLILLMTDGAWTRFSLYQLAQTVMKNLVNLPELPNSTLKQAAKGGVCDDMTIVTIVIRRH